MGARYARLWVAKAQTSKGEMAMNKDKQISQLIAIRAQLRKVIPITGCNVVLLDKVENMLSDMQFSIYLELCREIRNEASQPETEVSGAIT